MKAPTHIRIDQPISPVDCPATNRVVSAILDTDIPTVLSANLGPWTPLRATNTNRTTWLDILTDARGHSQFTITRRRNGAVTLHIRGVRDDDHPLALWPNEITLPFIQAAREALTSHLYHPDTSADWHDAMTQLTGVYRINSALNQAIAKATPALTQAAPAPAWADSNNWLNTSLNSPASTYNSAISQLLDPQVKTILAWLNTTTLRTPPTFRQYTDVALNLGTYAELQNSSPNTLRHYWCAIAQQGHPVQRTTHPSQVIDAVQKDLNLTPAQWRYFCRVVPDHRQHDPDSRRRAVQLSCRALADANQPDAPDLMLDIVAQQVPTHAQMADPGNWRHGSPWRAWTQLLSQYLQQSPGENFHPDDLFHVTDALQAHIEQQLPWRPAPWQHLVNRSTRWHQENQTPGALNPAASWESLIPETVINDVTFTPVTRGRELINLGSTMRNCIGSYVTRCVQGTCRIFLATTPTRAYAALEIRIDGDTCYQGQLEAPRRGSPPVRARKAAQQLVDLYQQALTKPASGPASPGPTPQQDHRDPDHQAVPTTPVE